MKADSGYKHCGNKIYIKNNKCAPKGFVSLYITMENDECSQAMVAEPQEKMNQGYLMFRDSKFSFQNTLF